MGIAMEWNDTRGFCDYADLDYVSDLTDMENDVEEYAFTPRAFERGVPRSSKRTYGVFVDSAAAGVALKRRKRSRVDEQLELLRAAIPSVCTNEKASILAGAYEYIEKLQRQVEELHNELDTESACSDDDDDDDDVSSCEYGLSRREEERPLDSIAVLEAGRAECCGCSLPMAEVVRTEQGLKIHIQCEKRSRVLADIMELLESSGMNVEQVSIAYQEDSQFVFDCVGSEVDGKVAVDSKYVETRLKSLVADQREPSVE